MKHPFSLIGNQNRDQEIDFKELITDEEAGNITGGMMTLPIQRPGIPIRCYVPTPYPYCPQPIPFPLPKPYIPFPICSPNPSVVTTLALGEEGGSSYFC